MKTRPFYKNYRRGSSTSFVVVVFLIALLGIVVYLSNNETPLIEDMGLSDTDSERPKANPIAPNSAGSESTSSGGSSSSKVSANILDHPKVAAEIDSMISRVDLAFKGGSSDVSNLQTALVHVVANGDIEVLFISDIDVTSREEQDIKNAGGTIVSRSSSNDIPTGMRFGQFGVIRAWVPYNRVHEVANRAWVTLVTPPEY